MRKRRGVSDETATTDELDGKLLYSHYRVLGSLVGAGNCSDVLVGGADSVSPTEEGMIGSFERGTDGWNTDGDNSLHRVSATDQQAPVTQGEYALAVETSGDPQPSIWKRDGIETVDFAETPHLFADVLVDDIAGTDSPVTFRFRCHSETGDVIESAETTVRQRYGAGLSWDMSGLNTTTFGSPRRLELTWYLTDHPPKTGPQREAPDVEYSGSTYIDNVRFVNDPKQAQLREWVIEKREVQRENGFRIETAINNRAGRSWRDA